MQANRNQHAWHPSRHWGGLWFLPVVALVVGQGCERKKTPPSQPPVAVIAAEVLVRDQMIFAEHIGQTRGSQEVEVRARVSGFLETIDFAEGRVVEKGELLYTIDPKPYQAAVAEAKGQLAQAEANWAKARQDIARFEPLIERNAISRQQYDDALAAEKAMQATVASADAALESAKLELSYTTITAPVTGLIGKNEVQPGNLVGQGQPTLLAHISTIDPIHVRFSVSEKAYLRWARDKASEEELRHAAQNRFELILTDGAPYSHKGSLVFVDRNVDLTTGTLLLEAAFPNPTKLLRPGQSVRVRFPVESLTNAILVPQRAVQELQATYSVFVVNPDHRADVRSVEPGSRVGGLWVITAGLNPGDKVVIEGLQKLQPGVPVTANLVEIQPEVAGNETNSVPHNAQSLPTQAPATNR